MRAEADQVAAMAMRFVERCGAMTIDRVPTTITMVQGTIPTLPAGRSPGLHCPERVRLEDITHTLRAVLWLMTAHEDPGASAHWPRWQRPTSRVPRSGGRGNRLG
ncbi:MAG: hypothetical protein ACOYES_09000 [Bacillota bacterium]|jgi:hypothetical protein